MSDSKQPEEPVFIKNEELRTVEVDKHGAIAKGRSTGPNDASVRRVLKTEDDNATDINVVGGNRFANDMNSPEMRRVAGLDAASLNRNAQALDSSELKNLARALHDLDKPLPTKTDAQLKAQAQAAADEQQFQQAEMNFPARVVHIKQENDRVKDVLAEMEKQMGKK